MSRVNFSPLQRLPEYCTAGPSLGIKELMLPLYVQDVSVADVLKGIEEASVSTVDRCAKFQAELE